MHKIMGIDSTYQDSYGYVADNYHAVIFIGEVEIANAVGASERMDERGQGYEEDFEVVSVGEAESIEAFAKDNDGVWVVDVANKRVGFYYADNAIEDINWESDSGIGVIDRFIR